MAEDPNDPSETIPVEFFLLRQKTIEKGKVYEFLGEIEQIKVGGNPALKPNEAAGEEVNNENSPPAKGPDARDDSLENNDDHESGDKPMEKS